MATFAEEDLFGSSSEEEEEIVEGTVDDSVADEDGRVKAAFLESLLPTNYSVPAAHRATKVRVGGLGKSRENYFDDNFSTPFAAKETLLYRHESLGFKGDFAGGERGGGRGFVAIADIYPGTLLLAERMYIPASLQRAPQPPSQAQLSDRRVVRLLRNIFFTEEGEGGDTGRQQRTVSQALKNLSSLHPHTFVDIETDHAEKIKQEYQKDIGVLLNSEEEGIPKELLHRYQIDGERLVLLLCKLHFNAFPSGVYLHFAMINHSCRPNCIKIAADKDNDYSSLKAMELIPKGTELTIAYISELELRTRTRQDRLHKQFRFHCSCTLCTDPFLLSVLEPAGMHTEKESNEYAIIVSLCEEKKTYKTMKQLDYLVQGRDSYLMRTKETDILVARMNRLLCRACESILRYTKDSTTASVSLSMDQHLRLLEVFLRALLMLRKSELAYVGGGPTFRTTETLSQIAHVINSILAFGLAGTRVLEDETKCFRKEYFSTASKAAAFGRTCDRICQQISRLYEHK